MVKVAPLEPASAPSDADLVAEVASGELGALGTLYDRYGADLLRFLRRASSIDESEDILHETFVRVISISGSFDPNAASARPWLFGIAYRVVRERRRTMARLFRVLQSLAEEPRSPRPPTNAEGRDIERALSRLTPQKRETLVLAEVHGFTGEEIAVMLDIPINTVWTRLHHARRELRALLGGP